MLFIFSFLIKYVSYLIFPVEITIPSALNSNATGLINNLFIPSNINLQVKINIGKGNTININNLTDITKSLST